jgi:hypothetical protein
MQKPERETFMSCLHENAVITFYEEKGTVYCLQARVIAKTNNDIKPQPLQKVTITCPDCPLVDVTYPDWRQAPEPLRTYCQNVRKPEYNVPDPTSSSQAVTVLSSKLSERPKAAQRTRLRKRRCRALKVVIWCARKHRHHHWSPITMTLLLCCVVGSLISHIDGALIIGEMLIALLDMVLQGYNAYHYLKQKHRMLKRSNPKHWKHIRRKHLWRELRFKSPLALCILLIIVLVLFAFHFPL